MKKFFANSLFIQLVHTTNSISMCIAIQNRTYVHINYSIFKRDPGFLLCLLILGRFRRPIRRFDDNIKTNLQETGLRERKTGLIPLRIGTSGGL